jgi:very-short-patch-repair endonuclease
MVSKAKMTARNATGMTYGKRPRRKIPPPLAGGGDASDSERRGRGPTVRSRQLRANSTDAETKLWNALRRKSIEGLRFRRQFYLGPYFADFICLPARLVVEVDGGQHGQSTQLVHDRRRTAWLKSQHFRVLRFRNAEVLTNLDGALYAIECVVREQLSYHPLPQASVASRRPLAPSRKGRGNSSQERGEGSS